ncbi:MAG TPA: copper chaperone PCu(A)C [Streptosporangiaceae bacterium]
MLPLSRPTARTAAASRSSRRGPRALRRACAVAAVALIPVLAGCEAGGDPPVLNWHPPTGGASATIKEGTGEIAIRNVFVLGAPTNATLPAGSSAGLFVGLVNTGPRDRLVRVSAPGSATSVTMPAGGVLLERDQSALLTGPAPELILTGLTRSLPGGSYIKVLLTFLRAGTVSLDVPVIARSDSFATFSPAPTASPTPSATAKHKHRGKGSATATPSPGATATATASATATP